MSDVSTRRKAEKSEYGQIDAFIELFECFSRIFRQLEYDGPQFSVDVIFIWLAQCKLLLLKIRLRSKKEIVECFTFGNIS